MITINHIHIVARNIYESAYALRQQTGLGYFDGGYNDGGVGNKIFPLGGGAYIQLAGIVDAYAPGDPARPNAKRTVDQTRNGEVFQSLNLRGDMADMEAVAQRHGLKVAENPGGRIQANGRLQRTVALSATPPGMPPIYSFPDFPEHGSSGTPDPAPGLVRPLGISFVELSGDAAAIAAWVGPDAAKLPLRFVGGEPGVRAVGVRTSAGEVIITTPFKRGA